VIRQVASAAVAVVLVAGCGTATVTPSPSPTPAATVPPNPSTSATVAPSAQPTPESTPAASPLPLPQGSEAVALDPALFAGVAIDNPYWPLARGSHWVYSEDDGEGNVNRVEVTVLDGAKEILGIQATVVHDVVSLDGEILEDTFDWYAQDTFGNVWYMGEDTKELENGKVTSTEGSWEAGVDGAQAGVIMPAEPQVGMAYRQEWYTGHAEDTAEVLSLDGSVTVPAGTYTNLLQTREHTALEPDVVEEKLYAKGVGEVAATQTAGGTSIEKLLEFTPGG
jgi:hypothetical protein